MQPICATGLRKKRFSKTEFANLWKDESSGNYIVRAKVCGKAFVRPLKTKSKSVAKTKMDEEIRLERLRRNRAAGDVLFEAKSTFAEVMVEYEAGIESDPDLKPRAKQYRKETLGQIRRSWPTFAAMVPAAISKADVESWAKRLRAKYSESRFNGAVQTMRALFSLAVEHGLTAENYAKKIELLTVLPKDKVLPTNAQFERTLKLLNCPTRKQAWAFVQVLAFSGQRPAGVRKLMPDHVDLARNVIRWPPIKHQAQFNEVPMGKRLRKVMVWLLKHHPRNGTPLLPILDPKKSLARASEDAGCVPALTPGALRHFWTTRALEAGITFADAARMRGDRDGGAMLARTYAHLRMEHLKRAIRKLK